jgi:hypothetical protein
MDINTCCKDNWKKLKEAAETAIRLEPDPDKKAEMEEELASFSVDIARHFMANGYNFPEPAGDFEEILRKAHQDVDKQKRLKEIFDKSVQVAGQAVDFTGKVVAFLGKYGKYLGLV